MICHSFYDFMIASSPIVLTFTFDILLVKYTSLGLMVPWLKDLSTLLTNMGENPSEMLPKQYSLIILEAERGTEESLSH